MHALFVYHGCLLGLAGKFVRKEKLNNIWFIVLFFFSPRVHCSRYICYLSTPCFFSSVSVSGLHALARALFYQFREIKLHLAYIIIMFYFSPCRYFLCLLCFGCFLTSLRGLYDFVSVLARYFDPPLMFVGHVPSPVHLLGLLGYRPNTSIP